MGTIRRFLLRDKINLMLTKYLITTFYMPKLFAKSKPVIEIIDLASETVVS